MSRIVQRTIPVFGTGPLPSFSLDHRTCPDSKGRARGSEEHEGLELWSWPSLEYTVCQGAAWKWTDGALLQLIQKGNNAHHMCVCVHTHTTHTCTSVLNQVCSSAVFRYWGNCLYSLLLYMQDKFKISHCDGNRMRMRCGPSLPATGVKSGLSTQLSILMQSNDVHHFCLSFLS